MKILFYVSISIILCLSIFGVVTNFSQNNDLKTNADYLRIHIRANSNSVLDQEIKYQIKDKFVEYLTPKVAFCNSKADVEKMILQEKNNLESLANKILTENNFDYCSNVKICSEMFPSRTYDGLTLESGIYDALIVELGKANGNNWWCVIYPPLCFTNFSQTNSSSVVYKSKILEIIRQFFT